MKRTQNQVWRILVTLALAAGLISPLSQAAQASDSTRTLLDLIDNIELDGVRDVGYIPLASDPSGDLGDPGGAPGTQWADLTQLYVAADAANLYVYADLPGYTQAGSTGSILLALDVDGDPLSGGTQDPWLNAIAFDYTAVDGAITLNTVQPDYVVRGHIPGNDPDPNIDNGWTELLAWDGSAWQGLGTNWGGIIAPGQIGSNIAYSDTHGVEFAIPLADIGNPQPAEVHLQLITTQTDINKGAYDTIPSDNQSAGWDEATTQTQLVSVPVAVDASGDLDPLGPGSWNGTAWSDVTRLHIWADDASLHVYLPMPAYDTSVSEGSFLVAINTTSGGGNTGDPWGNAITFDFDTIWQNLGYTPQATDAAPDFVIRGNIYGPGGNGWTELRTWNGSNFNTGGGVDWGGIGNSGEPSLPGSKVAWSDGDGLRFTIPFTDLGLAAEDQVDLQFMGTQTDSGKGAFDTVPTDDQTTGGWSDPTTQSIMASYIIPIIGQANAGHDNDIWWSALGHNSRDSQYRTPGGAVPTDTAVTLRLRAAKNDLTQAQVRLWNDRLDAQTILNMTLVATDVTYEYWEVTLPASADPTVYWYRFIVIDGTDTDYYADGAEKLGGWGEASDEEIDNSWQLTVYDPAFQTPEWIKNAVVYQIFPDRFYDGNPANNTSPGTFFYDESGGTIFRSDPGFGTDNPWNTYICDPRDNTDCPGTYSKNFYGGDLAGLTEKLPYLAGLGITAIYLNPIFESPSNHKYDTTDYSIIDDNFGSLADFEALVDAADALGIVLILDGVFNHVSSDSIYFDRYGQYASSLGACESNLSPYRDWFYFIPEVGGPCMGDDGTPNAASYESWWGYDSLPKMQANNPEVRDLIWATGATAIGPYWMDGGSTNSRAMGWRLDVAGDVDPGTLTDPTNDYWEGFRDATHAVNPETYIVGEEWGNSASWTIGGEWDASMNYPFGTAIMGFWRDTDFVDNDHNDGSSAGVIAALTPSELNERLLNLQERYAPEAFYAMMNLLGSHDTNRALFMLDSRTGENDDSIYLDPAYDWSDAIQRLQGVALLQFTLPGAPTIYYGDEVGLVGPVTYAGGKWEDDPYNRQPFPWIDNPDLLGIPYYEHLQSEAGQDVLHDWYSLLISIRNDHPALRTGTFDPLLTDDDNMVYAYGRKLLIENDAAVVVLNREAAAQAVILDLNGYLPVGAVLINALDDASYTIQPDGSLNLPAVPGMSGMVLVLDSGDLTPPDAPTNLVAVESESQVDLSWDGVAGAASYKVYRSQVSGGGYVFLANAPTNAYTDLAVVNGTQYYYVVTTIGTNGLESIYSNEAGALPHWDIDYAVISTPAEITHTVGITPTEEIFGRIWINGVTTETGQTPGLLAQIGLGALGSDPTGWSQWVDAPFFQDFGVYDEFAGVLTPETVDEYNFVYRFSTTNGRDWVYADLWGIYPSMPIMPGVLHVVSSGDTVAPTTPANLRVVDSAGTFVQLAWDPIEGDPTLYAYDLFRSDAEGYTGELLARVLAPASGYVDWSVTTGVTYYYYVQAVDRSFNRSGYSNEVNATPTHQPVTVVFNVTVPAGTPGTVYIAGNMANQFGGSWNPGGQPLSPSGTPDVWTISLDFMEGDALEFKFARGTWDTVEKKADGLTEVANRKLNVVYLPSRTQIVNLVVANWRDPFVTGFSPAAGATGVYTDTVIQVTWNQSMTISTTFSVIGPAGPVAGTFSYDDPSWTVTFTPDQPLRTGTTYTVIVEGQRDLHNDLQFAPIEWSFTTEGYQVLLLPMIQRH